MLNPFNWFKRNKTVPRSAPSMTDTSDRSNQAAAKNTLRRQEFASLNINYDRVLLVEANGITGINPQNIIAETNTINVQLINLGFIIQIDFLESFECQLLYLDYQNYRDAYYKAKKIILPEHTLIEIIILRAAEKQVRHKYKLTENPTTGHIAHKFSTEVKIIYEALCDESREKLLRQQAITRIRLEKNLDHTVIISESDIMTMIKKIVTRQNRK